jgi:bifunctional non-homologous end joining protein LigD
VQRQEFVIGGFTEPAGARKGLGALLLGFQDHGELKFCGRVGTGFTAASLGELRRRLEKLETDSPPFVDVPRARSARGVHWVKPVLVAEVAFAGWTKEGRLRAPSFQGLREDKVAAEIVRERPAAANPTSARSGGAVEVAGVRLTHPDRVLYPEQGLTKRDLALYYESVGERMLPYVAGRPLTLVRCPEGHAKQCFIQRHIKNDFPDAVRRLEVREKKPVVYPVVDSVAGLVALVQMGVLEIHPWGSPGDRLEEPDRMLFDLDPDPSVDWKLVIEAARLLRERLSEAGLVSFVKTTGGKGLHVVSPLAGKTSWKQASSFARALAETITADAPERYLSEASKAKRKGKIFIDYLRNARSATAVAAYSTRARRGAPVSTPVDWDELGRIRSSDQFTVENLRRRISSQKKDPWTDFERSRRALR